jgi:hypothetical protein
MTDHHVFGGILLERYAILMAGGSGLRLWPFSRKKKPKQFISADSGPCMMLETLERIRPVVPPDNCFVVTSRTLEEITRSTLKGTVPESNIILEPMPKNTAACIAYAVFTLKSKGIDGVLCFFPADGYVKNRTEYCSAVSRAYAAAEHTEGLVVIGLKPSRPATGYGYLRIGPGRPDEARPVLRFVEKPDRSGKIPVFRRLPVEQRDCGRQAFFLQRAYPVFSSQTFPYFFGSHGKSGRAGCRAVHSESILGDSGSFVRQGRFGKKR